MSLSNLFNRRQLKREVNLRFLVSHHPRPLISVSLAVQMLKNLDTMVWSEDEQDLEEKMDEDDNNDPDQGNNEAQSSAHTVPHEENPVQDHMTEKIEIPSKSTATGEIEVAVATTTDGQTEVAVESLATRDEAGQSVTESELGDRTQAMEIDQSGDPKETIPETGHLSPSGHEATPSSFPSKIASDRDASQILPTA